MTEQEGVIKYQLMFTETNPDWDHSVVAELTRWRAVLHRLQLVGQQPDRYDGYGYGNVSVRYRNGFIISGTQTGTDLVLGDEFYSQVTGCEPESNRLVAHGRVKPSSESLTHGVVYLHYPEIYCVLHAHSPEIWHATEKLSLPATGADVPYGTPEMAEAVTQVIQQSKVQSGGLFTMLGHEDGVVAIGQSVESAAQILIQTLAAAIAN